MKILSDAESAGIKILVVILVATLIALIFWKMPKQPYTVLPEGAESAFDGRCSGCGEPVPVVHDTVIEHDTVVDVHAITKTVTIHDTIYITD